MEMLAFHCLVAVAPVGLGETRLADALDTSSPASFFPCAAYAVGFFARRRALEILLAMILFICLTCSSKAAILSSMSLMPLMCFSHSACLAAILALMSSEVSTLAEAPPAYCEFR